MSLKYVDAHTHPLKEYYDDNYHVIEKAYAKGVAALLITGCNELENEEVIKIARNFHYTFPVIGIHPNEANGKIDGQIIERQLDSSVVAIGEIGLDYFYTPERRSIQIESLHAQIQVALKHNLPVVIHMRDSYEDLYEIIKQYHKEVKFMIHTYSGNLYWTKKFYKLGCYFSFSGVSTYKNAAETVEVIDWVPVERILTETDAPYLAPANKRSKINYPNYVIHTANYIAGIKKMSIEKFTDQVLKNAKELFKINVSRK
ncbi:TatD family hydrolase [Mycoplasmopsis caviae]|uniref:TatD DNase family protein n=1 Tax=Mycoplasmopsis caviae TaxID=55603 RepID=A0A3P8KLU1_9BACT|nr:TatD family hydrolase [Mycoplasmopsis caviae]UUD35496.1 TatD family hydrolase [Mycoplasmopsis caviae]VDR41728.1 TatD DNase family protein [Mycoplasmopsis caviae]